MAPRFKHQPREDGLPEIHTNYCFMSTEGNPLATISVARETATKMTMATVVPMKCGPTEFPPKRMLSVLKEFGLEGSNVVLRSDQEPAIEDLLKYIATQRSAGSKLEKVEEAEGDGMHEVLRGRGSEDSGVHPAVRSVHESSFVGSSGSNRFIGRVIQVEEGQVRIIKFVLESYL